MDWPIGVSPPGEKALTLADSHRIHGAAIYGNMDPIHIPPMLVYIPYMDPMGFASGGKIGNRRLCDRVRPGHHLTGNDGHK